jgi:hypothetical protein
MTYNFDPDRWYENERALIEERSKTGQITAIEYENAIRDLDRRYNDMLARLDGTYQLPTEDPPPK